MHAGLDLCGMNTWNSRAVPNTVATSRNIERIRLEAAAGAHPHGHVRHNSQRPLLGVDKVEIHDLAAEVRRSK